jgi:hypothetical protein
MLEWMPGVTICSTWNDIDDRIAVGSFNGKAITMAR